MVDGKGVPSTYNCIYWRRKGVETVFVTPWKYSPGYNKKKKYIQDRSAMACCIVVVTWAVESIKWRMYIGMGRTREGAGYLRA